MSIFKKDDENEMEYTGILGDAASDNEGADPYTSVEESAEGVLMGEEEEVFLSEEDAEESYDGDFAGAAPPVQPKKSKTVPLWVIPVVVACVVLLFVGGFFGVKYLPGVFQTMSASRLAKDGHYYAAMQSYVTIQEKKPEDKRVALKLAEVMVKMGYFSDAQAALSSAYTQEQLDNASGKLKELNDILTKMTATSDFVNNLYTEFSQSGDTQTALDALESNKNSGQYLDEFLTYYQYIFAAMGGQDPTVQEEYVKKACAYDSDISYLFYTTRATFLRYNKDFDEAIKVCNEALAYNKDDFSAYGELSYVALLQGDNQKALDYATRAHEIAADQATTTNVLLLAYAATGMDAEYATLMTQAEADGITVNEAVIGFKEGTYTLNQLLLGEEADVPNDEGTIEQAPPVETEAPETEAPETEAGAE